MSFIWLAASILAFSPDVFRDHPDEKQLLHNNITDAVWRYYEHDLHNPVDTSWLTDLDTVNQTYLDSLGKLTGSHYTITPDSSGICAYLVKMELIHNRSKRTESPVILLDNHFRCFHVFDSSVVQPRHWF